MLFVLRFPIEDDRIMFTFHSMEIALEAKVTIINIKEQKSHFDKTKTLSKVRKITKAMINSPIFLFNKLSSLSL